MDEVRNITLNVSAISHIGCVRHNNEDNLFVDGELMEDQEVNRGIFFTETLVNPWHLLAICDGMGGLEEGERAASIGVHRLNSLMQPTPMLAVQSKIDEYARKTSIEIDAECSARIQNGGKAGKEGTTLALVYMYGNFVHVANVGDSRVYILRLDQLIQVSEDQTLLYRQMQEGKMTREEMRKHPRSNVIDRFLGMPESAIGSDFVTHRELELCDNDRILICSDGLSDLVPHKEMERILISERNPENAAKVLVSTALELSGKDNTTVIVADVSDNAMCKPTQKMVETLKAFNEPGDTTTS